MNILVGLALVGFGLLTPMHWLSWPFCIIGASLIGVGICDFIQEKMK